MVQRVIQFSGDGEFARSSSGATFEFLTCVLICNSLCVEATCYQCVYMTQITGKELCDSTASCFSKGIGHVSPLHPDFVISLREAAKAWMYTDVVNMMTFLARPGKTRQDMTLHDKIRLLRI